jgi:competence protein ComEA
METVREKFIEILQDPKKRKAFALAVVVIVVVAIGAGRYTALVESRQGDIVIQAEREGQGVEAGNAADTSVGGEGDGQAALSSGGDGGVGTSAVDSGTGGTNGTESNPGAAADNDMVFVDIGGAVNNPGVIALPGGSRVVDAISAAGGLCENANVQMINQAAVLTDSDKVYIPTDEEVESGEIPPGAGTGAANAGSAAASGTDGNVAPVAASGTDAQGKININTADADTLQQLNGVGPSTAQKIIDYRTSVGAFHAIEDIMNVSGIGQKTFEKLKPNITV